MLKRSFYEWKETNIKNSPKGPGVYGLYDKNQNIIYVGKSKDINQRLLGYLSRGFSEDQCKKSTRFYKRESTDNPEKREKELLIQFKRKCGGLPRCNDIV